MKKLILILLLFPLFGLSQETFFTEWKKYLADCNELVNDTVIQKGTVNCELVQVKMNGKIVSYSQVPKDTVWNKCECKDYKKYYYDGINIYNGSISTTYAASGTFTLTGNYSASILSDAEPAKNIFSITRKKICTIKKCPATLDDFINRWCVNKKLIEFN